MSKWVKGTAGSLLKQFKTKANAIWRFVLEWAIAFQEGEGPVIRLPRDKKRITELKAKLAEYQARRAKHLARMDAYKAPEIWFDTDSEHKTAVLSELLKTGRVGTWALSRRLIKKFGQHFDVCAYDRACNVIADYCETGGAHVHGGTGLPEQTSA